MKQKLILLLCLACWLPSLAATGLKGTVVDASTSKPVANANVLLRDQGILAITDDGGVFTISNAQVGTDVLEIIATGYSDFYMDVEIVGGIVKNLGEIKLSAAGYSEDNFNDDLVFDELQIFDDESSNQSIGTIQGATDDIYFQQANYNFQPMYFRIRGYNSEMQAGYVNGVEMNDPRSGRFNFSGLGGMTSTAFRSRTVGVGTEAVNFGFGDLGGATNYTTYASEFAPGFRGLATYTNSNYMLRAGFQYASGVNKHGWAFVGSVLGRWSNEGVIEGTFYNSLGVMLSLQKIFNDQHSLNITAWGAPTQSAGQSYSYQEVYDLVGSNTYNPAWGWFNGKKRSSKIRNTFDPSVIVNWIWKPKMGTTLNTALGFRSNRYATTSFDRTSNSADPRPDYYKYLPSYYAPTADEGTALYNYQLGVYNYETELWRSKNASVTQIDWDGIYYANTMNRQAYDRDPSLVGQSSYILSARHTNTTSALFNTYLNHRLNDNMTLQAGIAVNYTQSHFYKTVYDLLGGDFWLDIETFYERDFSTADQQLQNNLLNPNFKAKKGDIIGYDYDIRFLKANAWLQNQIRTNHWDVNYGIDVAFTTFQRHGNMLNGRSPEDSYGTGARHSFDDAAIKAGATYKLNGRNYFVGHAAYGTKAPSYDKVYINARIKDAVVPDMVSERYFSGDLSYAWNYQRFRGSITGYFTHTWDGLEYTLYYDDELSTNSTCILSGVDREYKGIELGMAYNITPSLTVTAVGTISRAQYKNRPTAIRSYENGLYEDTQTTVYLKNYYLGGAPQQAYNIGFDYAAPGMWFFNINGSWMGDGYMYLSPMRHMAMSGLTSAGDTKDEILAKAKAITKQDKLNNAFVLNASIGKVLYTSFGSVNFNLNLTNILNNRNIMVFGQQQNRFDYTNYDASKWANRITYAQGIKIYFNVGIRF